jgi:FkbM family methyltransferase
MSGMPGLIAGWRPFRGRPQAEPGADPWAGDFDPAADAADIRACFRLLLGRLPHREEWPGHSQQAGQPLAGVVAGYLNSLEFSRRRLLRDDTPSDVALADLGEFRIHAAASDAAVGRHVLAGAYEPEVSAVFRRTLRPGMGVLDLGANIGYFTMLAAALVGADGHVLAFEPNPRNTRLLEASRRANGFGQVTVCQAAAGPRVGLLALHRTHSNGTTSALPDDPRGMPGAILAEMGAADLVPCLPPDALVPAGRRIDLVKVDVEGAEYLALSGCAAILARDRPVIVSEFSPDLMPGISGIDGPGYLDWLAGQGYRLAVLEPDGTERPAATSGDVMAAYHDRGIDHVDIVARPVRSEAAQRPGALPHRR